MKKKEEQTKNIFVPHQSICYSFKRMPKRFFMLNTCVCCWCYHFKNYFCIKSCTHYRCEL